MYLASAALTATMMTDGHRLLQPLSDMVTWARAGGDKIDAVSDWLGHASVDTTRMYVPIVNRLKENPATFQAAFLALIELTGARYRLSNGWNR